MIAFVEKPAPGKAPSNWINAGTYVSSRRSSTASRPASTCRSSARRFLAHARAAGRLYGYKTDAYWLDIGTPEKYLAGALDVRMAARRTGRARAACGQGDAVSSPARDGAPCCSEGAHVESGAQCRGGVRSSRPARASSRPCCTPAHVSHGSTVRHSVVGADTVLKPEVALSALTIIGAGVTVPSGSMISGGRSRPNAIAPV